MMLTTHSRFKLKPSVKLVLCRKELKKEANVEGTSKQRQLFKVRLVGDICYLLVSINCCKLAGSCLCAVRLTINYFILHHCPLFKLGNKENPSLGDDQLITFEQIQCCLFVK